MSQKKFAVGKGFEMQENEEKEKKVKSAQSNFLLAKYINVGYYLLAPLLLGVFAGFMLDRFLKTKPIFTLIFILLGVAGTFYNLFKITKNNF